MPLLRLICCFGLIFTLGLAVPSSATSQEDPFVALQTNNPGIFSYVRRQEIEALTDVSPSHCVLLLSPDKLAMRCTKHYYTNNSLASCAFANFFGAELAGKKARPLEAVLPGIR
jgi:hypothetical protein